MHFQLAPPVSVGAVMGTVSLVGCGVTAGMTVETGRTSTTAVSSACATINKGCGVFGTVIYVISGMRSSP